MPSVLKTLAPYILAVLSFGSAAYEYHGRQNDAATHQTELGRAIIHVLKTCQPE